MATKRSFQWRLAMLIVGCLQVGCCGVLPPVSLRWSNTLIFSTLRLHARVLFPRVPQIALRCTHIVFHFFSPNAPEFFNGRRHLWVSLAPAAPRERWLELLSSAAPHTARYASFPRCTAGRPFRTRCLCLRRALPASPRPTSTGCSSWRGART